MPKKPKISFRRKIEPLRGLIEAFLTALAGDRPRGNGHAKSPLPDSVRYGGTWPRKN
jgi:hypothetical protein